MFHILVIEDPANKLGAVEAILKQDNRKITRVQSGARAIELLNEFDIGLVIADLHISFEERNDPIRHISRNSHNAYVIFVTDRSNLQENIVHGLDQGAVDYLIRPLHPGITSLKVRVFERLYHKRKLLENKNQHIRNLLLNILPKKTADELEATGKATVRTYELATVMFTDFKGFTKIAEELEPTDLVRYLNRFFSAFDYIADNYYMEKIKTIGDAYMAVGGVPVKNNYNPVFSLLAAMEIRNYMEMIAREELMKENGQKWALRIGLHSGPLIAGVVGTRKWQYDVWGDTVNTAARIETQGAPGKINISGDTYAYIKEYFICTYRGKIKAKYKGELDMYYVERIKPEYAADEAGKVPSEAFRKILSAS